jgi:succinate-semialdehyde dehydrogenase/glutarate-semialdehyde dehydrogenase
VRKLRLGDGLEAGVTTGPLISQAGLDKVTHHVNDALSKGGQVRQATWSGGLARGEWLLGA